MIYPDRIEVIQLLEDIQKHLNQYAPVSYSLKDIELDITLGLSYETGKWDIQTGDNTTFGRAYKHQLWAIGSMDMTTDITELTDMLLEQLHDEIEEIEED